MAFTILDIGQDHGRGFLTFEAVKAVEGNLPLTPDLGTIRPIVACKAANDLPANPFASPEWRLTHPLEREDNDLLRGEAERQQVGKHRLEGFDLILRSLVIVHTDTQPWQGIGGLEVEGQVLAHKAGDAVGRAIVLPHPQAHKSRLVQCRLIEQILIRVVQPEDMAVPAQEELKDLKPVRRKVLSFVHNQGVEAPIVGDGCGEHPVLDGVPEIGLVHPAIIQGFAPAPQEQVAETVKGVGADLGQQDLQAVRQGAIEADHEYPPSLGGLVPGEDAGEQALAAAGRAGHPHPEGGHLQAPNQFGQAAAMADEVSFLGLAVGVDVGHHLEGLAKEILDQGAPRGIGLAGAKDALDAPGQTIAGGGVEDAALIQAGGIEVTDAVVRAVEQVVQGQRSGLGMLPLVLVADLIQGAVNLGADGLVTLAIDLDQAVRGLRQGAVLLFDAEHGAGAVDQDEIDLAKAGALAVAEAPMDAVKHDIIGSELVLEKRQGLQFPGVGAGQGQGTDVGGDDTGHVPHAPVVVINAGIHSDPY